jgi:hypothetical protein
MNGISMMQDIALTEDENGVVLAHRADCPDVRRQAAEGRPVVTMVGCQGPLPLRIKRHACLPPPVAGSDP